MPTLKSFSVPTMLLRTLLYGNFSLYLKSPYKIWKRYLRTACIFIRTLVVPLHLQSADPLCYTFFSFSTWHSLLHILWSLSRLHIIFSIMRLLDIANIFLYLLLPPSRNDGDYSLIKFVFILFYSFSGSSISHYYFIFYSPFIFLPLRL